MSSIDNNDELIKEDKPKKENQKKTTIERFNKIKSNIDLLKPAKPVRINFYLEHIKLRKLWS